VYGRGVIQEKLRYRNLSYSLGQCPSEHLPEPHRRTHPEEEPDQNIRVLGRDLTSTQGGGATISRDSTPMGKAPANINKNSRDTVNHKKERRGGLAGS